MSADRSQREELHSQLTRFRRRLGVTAFRWPSDRALATILDKQLGLQNHIASAVQYADGGDAFSQLVVRDAIQRLSAHDPSRVFPLGVTPFVVAVCVVGGAAAAMLPIARYSPDREVGVHSQNGAALEDSTTSARATAAHPNTSAIQAPAIPNTNAQAPRQPDSRTTAAAQGTPSAPSTSSAGAAAGSSAAISTARASSATDAAGDNAGAAAVADATGSRSTRAGGVGAADAPSGQSSAAATASSAAVRAAAYRAGMADAETAIAREKIAADRRQYVRRYFAAIRPEATR